ncbi:hypothetical protein NZD89_27400 [Alicyclobacillus fastidiosus]|uniref:Uncharacterized protein n=1 Tax=Alicyclobacillus fastidiosus TaxID=392011 RepID=A0ABY6ZG94_9BACL|nr:hypothetical protein [Alicyclobacillus fastidiosus]WAH41882.1 hypothetical protein NZD89_27400 [Alicyclobacillus fastidiosus]GMA63593.1 hypothetical protein GCM10025859_40330 [Alicyclobacillus fastidiosus]
MQDVDAALTKAQTPKRKTPTPRKSRTVRRPTGRAQSAVRPSGNATGSAKKKGQSLSQLLSPKNVQETMKTVGNLRGMVKNWLGYLQQADKMLDTIFVTTGSLKESGVLDKLVKHRGKNLSTDDFTSILSALMASPLASGFLKGGDSETGEGQAEQSAVQRPQQQALPPPQQQHPPQM